MALGYAEDSLESIVRRRIGGEAMGWAEWAKPRGPEFQAKKTKNNFPVTVKIRTSGCQKLECFIATLPTGRLVHVGKTFNRFAEFGL